MKKWLLLLSCLLVFSADAFAQCAKCKKAVCDTGFLGGCNCDPGPLCNTCGACSVGICVFPCAQPGAATEKIFRSWSWITDTRFPQELGLTYPVLGKLIEAEQYKLATGKCTLGGARSGSFSLTDMRSTKPPFVDWESLADLPNHLIHYHVTSGAKRSPTYIDIYEDHWVVLGESKPGDEAKQVLLTATF